MKVTGYSLAQTKRLIRQYDYDAYALIGDTLFGLQAPSQLIISQDGPIIPIDDLDDVTRTLSLRIYARKIFASGC